MKLQTWVCPICDEIIAIDATVTTETVGPGVVAVSVRASGTFLADCYTHIWSHEEQHFFRPIVSA